MLVLQELVPKSDFLQVAHEQRELVDGWFVTDSSRGIPAPSGTVVGSVLKSKYPDKTVLPVCILHYKSRVEVGALALAAAAVGVDGMVVDGPRFVLDPTSGELKPLWGDAPRYGEFVAMFRSPEEGREFLRETLGIKNLKIGGLISARFSSEECVAKAEDRWDFLVFMRLAEDSMYKLEEVSRACRKAGKPLYTYLMVATPKNRGLIGKIGWPSLSMERVEDFCEGLTGMVNGLIPTCVGDREGERELLRRLQKFRE
ncbi:MAG: hypothetical protein QXH26_00695 [Candidatus Hadarchaeales archaeon]